MKASNVSTARKLPDVEPVSSADRATDAPVFAHVLGASPLHLLHRLLQVSIDIYNAEVGDMAVTQRQFAVLQALSSADGVSQSQLCQATGMDRSTLAELVSRMAIKRLLRRERSRSDARVNLIWLDAAGREALNGLLPLVKAADAKILGMMSQPEFADLAKWLRYSGDKVEAPLAHPADEVAQQPAQKQKKTKKTKLVKALEKLPMPPLSKGAVADATDGEGETAHPRKWKPPKPIWNV